MTAQCDVPLDCYLFCLYTVHFSLALLNVNQQNASRRDATRCTSCSGLASYVCGERRPENGGQRMEASVIASLLTRFVLIDH